MFFAKRLLTSGWRLKCYHTWCVSQGSTRKTKPVRGMYTYNKGFIVAIWPNGIMGIGWGLQKAFVSSAGPQSEWGWHSGRKDGCEQERARKNWHLQGCDRTYSYIAGWSSHPSLPPTLVVRVACRWSWHPCHKANHSTLAQELEELWAWLLPMSTRWPSRDQTTSRQPAPTF